MNAIIRVYLIGDVVTSIAIINPQHGYYKHNSVYELKYTYEPSTAQDPLVEFFVVRGQEYAHIENGNKLVINADAVDGQAVQVQAKQYIIDSNENKIYQNSVMDVVSGVVLAYDNEPFIILQGYDIYSITDSSMSENPSAGFGVQTTSKSCLCRLNNKGRDLPCGLPLEGCSNYERRMNAHRMFNLIYFPKNVGMIQFTTDSGFWDRIEVYCFGIKDGDTSNTIHLLYSTGSLRNTSSVSFYRNLTSTNDSKYKLTEQTYDYEIWGSVNFNSAGIEIINKVINVSYYDIDGTFLGTIPINGQNGYTDWTLKSVDKLLSDEEIADRLLEYN